MDMVLEALWEKLFIWQNVNQEYEPISEYVGSWYVMRIEFDWFYLCSSTKRENLC
jgi:hypothetical protein